MLLKMPCLIAFVIDGEVGAPYGVGAPRKLRLLMTFWRNNKRVPTLSSIVEHTEMAAALLRSSPQAAGDVVECGCYMGGSTVNLSIVCELVGRRLVVFDSFAGLPEVDAEDRGYDAPHHGPHFVYEQGQFAASKSAVEANIERYGAPACCELVEGFFDETMRDFDRPVAMAFLDVDLVQSLRPCLQAIWPNLVGAGRVYVHEAEDLNFVGEFFNREWWTTVLSEDPPGLVGAGTGLPLTPLRGSDLGYAEKPATALAG